MEIELWREGRAAVVRPQGEVDVRTAPVLRRAMDDAVATAAGDLVVDLSAVTFIDSSGLGVLLGRFRRLPAGRTMVLRAPQPHVRALLELAGVPTLMRIEGDQPHSGGGGERRGRGA